MGSSDDVIPVTMGFVGDIQQQVAALNSVSLHWKLQECVGGISVGFYGADVSPVYFRRLLWSRCETSVLGESVEKNDSRL